MKYFTSDIHFNNTERLLSEHRPFKNAKVYDRYIIKSWNKQAKKGDTIYVIGDLFNCSKSDTDSWRKAMTYIKKVKADIILIVGNNEDRIIDKYFDNNLERFRDRCLSHGIKEVRRSMTIQIADQDAFLVHKPIDHKDGVINIFGHVHRIGGIYKPYGFNVSCDCNFFRLYSENDIIYMMELKEKYWDRDKSMNTLL